MNALSHFISKIFIKKKKKKEKGHLSSALVGKRVPAFEGSPGPPGPKSIGFHYKRLEGPFEWMITKVRSLNILIDSAKEWGSISIHAPPARWVAIIIPIFWNQHNHRLNYYLFLKNVPLPFRPSTCTVTDGRVNLKA